MFFKKKKTIKIYDEANFRAVIRCSICNGEQVAGFRNLHTGEFEEIMLIRNDRDLEEFKKTYNVSNVSKEY